jgi:hypothetical protein
MARSKLINPSDDLVTDSGAVLWSFIKGEQLEFPITMNFIENATAGYTYEAVVVEADNAAKQTDTPINIKPNGQQTVLNVRVPVYRGTWNGTQAYNREEIVFYNGMYYKLLAGIARTNSTAPDLDTLWEETALNRVYLQFPASLGANWTIQPEVGFPMYGFFELRVTEPTDAIFRRTWKPVRGMVEILFSPTDVVADV